VTDEQHEQEPETGSETGSDREPGEAAEQFEQAPDDSEVEEIEHDREERLDPDNRPDNVEIDNTQREFDVQKGMFTDSEGYDEADERFPPAAEQGA
jgi:hypothetical protein